MTYARAPRPPTTSPLHESTPTPWRRWLRDALLRIAGWLQGHPVWPYPLAQFYALEDRPGRVYVWTLHPETTREEATAIAEDFASSYVKRYNREPRALHIMTPDVDVLRRLDRSDAEQLLAHLKE